MDSATPGGDGDGRPAVEMTEKFLDELQKKAVTADLQKHKAYAVCASSHDHNLCRQSMGKVLLLLYLSVLHYCKCFLLSLGRTLAFLITFSLSRLSVVVGS